MTSVDSAENKQELKPCSLLEFTLYVLRLGTL